MRATERSKVNDMFLEFGMNRVDFDGDELLSPLP